MLTTQPPTPPLFISFSDLVSSWLARKHKLNNSLTLFFLYYSTETEYLSLSDTEKLKNNLRWTSAVFHASTRLSKGIIAYLIMAHIADTLGITFGNLFYSTHHLGAL